MITGLLRVSLGCEALQTIAAKQQRTTKLVPKMLPATLAYLRPNCQPCLIRLEGYTQQCTC